MPSTTPAQPETRQPSETHPGLLGPMRIRKKLLLLHTGFTVVLGAVLLLSFRPVGSELVRLTTDHAARATIALAIEHDAVPDPGASVRRGDAQTLGISEAEAAAMMRGEIIKLAGDGEGESVHLGAWDAFDEQFVVATSSPQASAGVVSRIYAFLIIAILVIYVLVALAIEFLVLPRHVYQPIRRMHEADLAVQDGLRDEEIIPENKIPSDEFGEIMRSRNESIQRLREQEHKLTNAMSRLETIAADLKQKNALIETAQRNLADQDRLASLGVMSAGLAHEMNTPLSVLKGAVEGISEKPDTPVPNWQSALMLRVIGRLERLSDGLLDFARARPSDAAPVRISEIVGEAWTLVHLDRAAKGVEFVSSLDQGAVIDGDADRLTQVFVNLLRNSVDAMEGSGKVELSSEQTRHDQQDWLVIKVANNGPRIAPDILPTLFEPFESTRLDDKGTGLGLAIAEGIIREHGGFIVARNLPERGCVFEISLPVGAAECTAATDPVSTDAPEENR